MAALVAHGIANSTNTNNATTAGVDTTGVKLIVLCIGGFTNTTVVSDSYANTWVALTSVGNGNNRGQLYYCLAPIVGVGHTFTIAGTSIFPSIAFLAFSSSGTITYDQSTQSNTQVSGAGSITPTGGAIFIAEISGDGTTIPTVDSSFTLTDYFLNGTGGSNARSLAIAWKSSASAENPLFTQNGSNVVLLADFVEVLTPLYDDNFQSYTLGQTPPYTNLSNNTNLSGGVSIINTIIGPYGESQCLHLPANSGVVFPILPTITLAQAVAGITYNSLLVPYYNDTSVFFAIRWESNPSFAGDILSFHSDVNPFSGIDIAAVRILIDGTIAITAPASSAFSPCQSISTYSLYSGKWYFFQTNITFSVSGGGFVVVTMLVLVNGVAVVGSTWTTTQPFSGVSAPYWNNLWLTGAGNGVSMNRLDIYDSLMPTPFYPHVGSPVARVTQGVIEIAKLVNSTVSLAAACPISSAPIGIAYSQSVIVSGGQVPYSYAVTSGSLPPGLSLNTSTGVISGTPTTSGSYPYQITVTDALSNHIIISCTLISPPTPVRPSRFCQARF